MINRRQFTKAVLAAGAILVSATRRRVWAATQYVPHMNDDGLYTQPWFMQTFLNLRDDLAEARNAGKRFVVFWEQKGCPYCKQMHTVNFARPEINDYVREHFSVLQLNLRGARGVTDFDGQTLTERQLALKYDVHFTPTIQFFPETVGNTSRRAGAELEIARMPGYFKPFHFMAMFEFVNGKLYERTSFQRYLHEKLAALHSQGLNPETW